MDTSIEYRIMCLKAEEIQQQWNPQIGDYIIAKASYCCDEDDNCNDIFPCEDCLRMSNEYVISGKYYFHESVGGTHWYYGGHSCVRGLGNRMNSTSCYVMTKERREYGDNDYSCSSFKEKLWLPRQDQIQKMFWNGLTEHAKLRMFIEWLDTATYNPHTYYLEMLWLMCYMETKHKKKWNAISNIKQWEDC